MNIITIDGNLGKDIEIKTYEKHGEQKKMGYFTLANKIGFGEKQKTQWVDCVIFGKKAEILAPYLLRGSRIVVRGGTAVMVPKVRSKILLPPSRARI